MIQAHQLLSALALALALSVDSFAVSLGAMKVSGGALKREFYFSRTCAAFAVAQSLLFGLGFLIGQSSHQFFTAIDHWVAAFILLFLAQKTWASRDEAIWHLDASEKRDFGQHFHTTALAALATSIDAFGAGTGSAFSKANFPLQIACVFFTTGAVVFAALHIGRRISHRLHKRLPHIATLTLIGLAGKILISAYLEQ